MGLMGGLIGLVVHVLLIMLGAAVAKIEKAGFWRSLGVALLSFLLIWVISFLVWPLKLVPIVGGLVVALVAFIGTSLAARLVFDCRWEAAWTLAFVVAVAQFVLKLLL
jgi:hypothetical protein